MCNSHNPVFLQCRIHVFSFTNTAIEEFSVSEPCHHFYIGIWINVWVFKSYWKHKKKKIYIYIENPSLWNAYEICTKIHQDFIHTVFWMINEPKSSIFSFLDLLYVQVFLFVIFQLVWQIVLLAGLRSTWAVLGEMHVRARVENKDNLSVVMCDSFIVFGRTRSCFGWLTCLGLIVWSGVCCASSIPALNYMTACSLLTLRVEVMWNVHVTKTHRT